MSLFNFDIAAAGYDDFYNNPRGQRIDKLEKESVSKFIKKLNGDLLVELGCGTGHWTSFFSENGFSVLGLDISLKMLAEAARKNIPNTILVMHDIHELPFLDSSIQNIAAIASLEFAEDQERVFSEIKRVLKPGGSLIVGCLNLNSQIGKTKSDDPVFKDANFFTYESLYNKLNEFGDPEIYGSVYMNEKFEIMDENADEEELRNFGVFLSGYVKKEKI